MAEFPVVYRQRFWPVRLNELLDYDSYLVEEFIKDTPDVKSLADKVIRVIEYPFHNGQPDDTHIYNAYHGKWCKTITLDYWQSSVETAALRLGDCEDGAILFVAAARAMNIRPEDVYVVFGYVVEVRTGEVLGGHAWAVINHESLGGGWRYVETTLDTPPSTYPAVQDIRKPFIWGGWELVPEIIWNDKYYEEIPVGAVLMARIISSLLKRRKDKPFRGYLDLGHSEKETRRKYEAISRMWGIQAKPLKKRGILARLRWR